jgi:RND family efflux transporter MFP subunit
LAAAIAEAEGEVSAAGVQIEAAKVKMERADKLRKENVGSLRAYQEAEAELLLAKAKAKAAQSRLATLRDVNLEVESGKVTSLAIESPQDGILQKVHAVPGEAVAAGAPLFEVTGIDPVWVRVPVYVGDLDSIDQQSPAGVTGLTSGGDSPVRSARPVVAPPSANTNAATVDLFYQLGNPEADLLPGQRVGVTLTLKGTEDSLVVPWSAILYDINGGTWVYEKTELHIFTRRRVEVRHVVDQMAVLSRGPAVGKKIVIAGAAELFGTEFGGGK